MKIESLKKLSVKTENFRIWAEDLIENKMLFKLYQHFKNL